jgi:hypothetical protein
MTICSGSTRRTISSHDKHHPELSDWFRSLANSQGTPCCDGSDATRIEDVDWQTICEAGTGECHYQVRLEGKWWHVPPTAVVQSGNRGHMTSSTSARIKPKRGERA